MSPLTGDAKRRWMATYRAKRYRERMLIAFERLGTRCVRCGADDPSELEFHHRDPEEKEFCIAEGWSVSLDRFLREVDKCEVLCIHCHVEVDPHRFSLARTVGV